MSYENEQGWLYFRRMGYRQASSSKNPGGKLCDFLESGGGGNTLISKKCVGNCTIF